MLEGESWHNSRLMVARALGRSLEADIEIDGLSRLLDEAYRHVVARAGDNPDLRFETVADKMGIVVTPLDKLDEPESLRALRAAVQTRRPKAGMPDIFLEVMARTGRTAERRLGKGWARTGRSRGSQNHTNKNKRNKTKRIKEKK